VGADPTGLGTVNPDTDTLTLIRTSFPGRELLVERAFREHQSFRDLCEDYRKCVGALHRWKQLTEDAAPPRWQEYTELLVELGREIQTWLEAMEIGSSHSSGGAQ
jgi:hypothetical protein